MNPDEFLWVRNRLDILGAKIDKLIALQTAGADFLPGTPSPDDVDAMDLLGGDTHGCICLDEEHAAAEGGVP
jgi:hypothetical protein